MNFKPSWITRGLTLVEVIIPDELEATLGSCDTVPPVPELGETWLNWGWLSKLKNSARNWRVLRSVMRVVFKIDMSKLNWPGPIRIPIPVLPNSVAQVGHAACVVTVTPSGIILGGAQKAPGLKYPGPPLYP